MSGFLTKIAHNNRVAIGRPNDVKLLGEVISTEKKVVDSIRRVATDRSKASTAIREWGTAEGADLGDVLSQLGVLFDYLVTAEHTFAEHNTNYRLHFKSIRTKEEQLSALKRAKENLAGKIESQDKKVAKMREENKDLPSASQRLMEMRQEMVGMENNVFNEEAHIYDFKRSAVRDAMSLKLGALTELSERMTIIGELGKLILDEVPRERTEPGGSRPYYDGHDKTQGFILEAQRCLQQVVFNPVPLTPNELREGRNGSGEEARFEQRNEYEYGYDQQGYASPQDHQQAMSPQGQGQGQGYQYEQPEGGFESNAFSPAEQQFDQHGRRPSGMQPLPRIETSPIRGVSDIPPSMGDAVEGYASNTPYLGVHHDFGAGKNRSSLAYMDEEDGLKEEAQQQRQVENEWARAVPEEQTQEAPPVQQDVGTTSFPQNMAPATSFQQELGSPSSYYTENEARRPSVESQLNAPPPLASTANFAPPPPPAQSTSTPIYAAYNKSKPPIIRGESALGSKHGDIYVSGRSEPTVGSANGPTGPFQGTGTSGYNSRAGGDASSVGSNDARKINAGAFRRNPQPQYSLPLNQDSRYPSQADAIRDQYRATSVDRDRETDEGAPRFDVSPLHVNKNRQGGVAPPARAGTFPNVFPSKETANLRGAESERWRDSHPDVPEPASGPSSESEHSTVTVAPPPSYTTGAVASPTSPTNGGSGFQSSQFVTRLD